MSLLPLALCAAALAQEAAPAPPWYLGLPVGQVNLEASGGELPDENLEPLLQARQGDRYSVQVIRSDLAVLYSTGLFSEVLAEAEPGVALNDQGEPVPGVWLTYRVWPAPVIAELDLEGVRALPRREVLVAAGLSLGARLLPAQDLDAARQGVLSRYEAEGFVGTQVSIDVTPLDAGRLSVTVRVREGAARTLSALSFSGEPALSERKMRRILREAGLRRGRRVKPDTLRAARAALTQALRDEGWPQARVSLLGQEDEVEGAEGARLVVVVDPGDRLLIEIDGLAWRERALVRDALGVEAEGRVSQRLVPELVERVTATTRALGYWEAEVGVSLVEEPGQRRLIVEIDAGPRTRLTRRHGLSFVGAEHFTPEQLAAAAAEASPDVIALGRVTPEELDRALAVLVELYRSNGYLSARLDAEPLSVELTPFGPRAQAVIQVEEGPRTILAGLELEGGAAELAEALTAEGLALVGHPLSPAALQTFAQEVAERHRALGYLGADVRVSTRLSEDRAAAVAVIEVQPGERLYLRNVIIRGARRTRRTVIEREVRLQTGEPITPEGLAQTRNELYDLNSFTLVDMSLQGEGDRLRDLVIDVQERPTWAFEVGGGVATDEGVRSFGRATRRHVFGLAHQVSALGQIGLGYVGDEWTLDTNTPEWRAGLRYEAPNLPLANQTFFFDVLLNEQDQEPTFRTSRMGVGVGVELPLRPTDYLAVEYRLQFRWLEDTDPGAFVSGDPWLGSLGLDYPVLTDPSGLPVGPRRQGGVTVRYLSDRRDSPFNPTRGALISAQLDTFDPLSSQLVGVKVSTQVRWLRPVGALSLQLRGQAGASWVQGRGTTLAVEDRFRIGGASTLRGYTLDSVGPANAVPQGQLALPEEINDLAEYVGRDSPERWVATGGDSMLLGTAELWLPFPTLGLSAWDTTSLCLFTDVGNVYFLDQTVRYTSQVRYDEPILRFSAGVGIRQATPLGPLQIDLALNPGYRLYPWAEARGEELLRFHISVGDL